jgi:ribosomal protein L29
MAIIRKRELKGMGKEELLQRLSELSLEKLKLRAQKGQATAGTKRLKELRKTVARIHTQLNQIEKPKI